ncbi:hypothetical protein BU17DRAFT_90519 [Hysterangium stoloniferum]|nr:hypothetical protein BU17DRAFT_90519 [Hysterangium stoloniferum]
MIIANPSLSRKESFPQGRQIPTVDTAIMDDPPPYVFPQDAPPLVNRPVPPIPRAASSPQLRPVPSSSQAFVQRPAHPIPATNFLFMQTSNESIIGAWNIDPDMSTAALAGPTGVDRKQYNIKHRQRHRHHGKKSFKKRKDLPAPNIIFGSRSGPMSIQLSVVAPPNAVHSRALVQAHSKSGQIQINIPYIHPLRRLNMEVSSRDGDIVILVPRSFSGYIQVYSKDGKINFLPNVMRSMYIVSRLVKEAQVVIGDAVANITHASPWDGDTLHVASKHGSIFIGYIGEDQKPTRESSWLKKVTNYLVQRAVQPTILAIQPPEGCAKRLAPSPHSANS